MIPTAQEIYDFLECYGIGESQLSIDWIEKRRDNYIIPYIERKIRCSLSSEETIIEYCNGTGNDIIMIGKRTATEVISIQYVAGGDFHTDMNMLNFILISSQGVIKAKYRQSSILPRRVAFPKGNRNIKITYKAGYTDLTLPEDLKEAIIYFIAEKALGFIGARTGGGSLSMQSFSRNYGNRGKYTDIRNELARDGHAIIKNHTTSVGGN